MPFGGRNIRVFSGIIGLRTDINNAVFIYYIVGVSLCTYVAD